MICRPSPHLEAIFVHHRLFFQNLLRIMKILLLFFFFKSLTKYISFQYEYFEEKKFLELYEKYRVFQHTFLRSIYLLKFIHP